MHGLHTWNRREALKKQGSNLHRRRHIHALLPIGHKFHPCRCIGNYDDIGWGEYIEFSKGGMREG